jgi:DNA-binding NtrC family response regulator
MPNIVVADYWLPGKFGGVEAIQRIQVALQTAIPAITVTGESDISAIHEIEQMGYVTGQAAPSDQVTMVQRRLCRQQSNRTGK